MLVFYILFVLFTLAAYVWGVKRWTDIPVRNIFKLDVPLLSIVAIVVGVIHFYG